MTLAGTTSFNGVYIKNENLLFDAATIIISNNDWSFQYYHKSPQYNTSVKIFYVSDDSFGVYVSEIDHKLYMYFNKAGNIRVTVPLNISSADTFKCYTFVKRIDDFYVFIDGNIVCNLPNIFSTRIYSSTVNYLCICPTSINYINSCNFMCFWSIALTNEFITKYFKYVYPNDSSSLIFNIRGDVDYTSNNNIVERDITSSSLVDVDVCANTGGTPQVI